MKKIDVNPIGGWQPNQYEREALEAKQMQQTLARINRILDRHFPPGRRLISGAATKADLERCLLHRAAAKGCKHARKFIGEFPGVIVLEADEPTDTDLEKIRAIRALGEEFPVLHRLLDRPDRREIVAEAMTVANRCYNGPEGALLLHFSDDRRGCLLCRMADRGDEIGRAHV